PTNNKMKRGTESEPVAVAWSRHQPEVREKLNAYDHAVLRAAERLIARVQPKALGPSGVQARKNRQDRKPGIARFLQQNRALIWSGTPGSNRRPSPWQAGNEDLQGDAARVN